MTLNQLLDRYISGERGGYYFDVIPDGRYEIAGGLFHYKQHARDNLLAKLVKYLDERVVREVEQVKSP